MFKQRAYASRMEIKRREETYEHTNTRTSQKDTSRQRLAPIILDLSLKLQESNSTTSKSINRLNIDLPQGIW